MIRRWQGVGAVAEQLRSCGELLAGGMPLPVAVQVAALDQRARRGGEAATFTTPAQLVPDTMPHARELLAGVQQPADAPVLAAAAEALEARGSRAPGSALLLMTLLVAVGLCIVFLLVVAPVFEEVAQGFDGLPVATQVVLGLARWVFVPGCLLALLALGLRQLLMRRPGWLGAAAPALERLVTRLPLVDDGSGLVLTRVLAGWLAATEGRGALPARIASLAELVGPSMLRRPLEALAARVQAGASLVDAVDGSPWLPGLALLLRREGTVPADLAVYAEALAARSDTRLAHATIFAQVVVGIIVAMVVIAVYLPIFRLGSAI